MNLRFALLVLACQVAQSPAAPPAYEVSVGTSNPDRHAEIRFADKTRKTVNLLDLNDAGQTWLPTFEVSPDRRWILCIQKVGSGDNVAWLYTVDDAGRVFRLEQTLYESAWAFSDTISPLKHSRLYHTGIKDPIWTERNSLVFTIRGSDTMQSGSGVEQRLEYDLSSGKITKK